MNVHFFSECSKTEYFWIIIKKKLNFCTLGLIHNEDLLNLNFPNFSEIKENTIIFVIANFVLFIHEKRKINEEFTLNDLRDYLNMKYVEYLKGKHPALTHISF